MNSASPLRIPVFNATIISDFFRETLPQTPQKEITSLQNHQSASYATMNENSEETPATAPSVTRFQNVQRLVPARPVPEIISADRFTFENVYALNIDMDIGDAKISSIITMQCVPAFLVNAFTSFWEIEGFNVEGVFRKEGAAARTKDGHLPVFFGVESIPENFRVHEICSWIKRFFRDIKTPLFGTIEGQLLKFAHSFQDSAVSHRMYVPLLNLVNDLPMAQCNTLAYLMRSLFEISEHSNVNQMTKHNLATVFAPSLFRATPPRVNHKSKKGNAQEDYLYQMKLTNELQVFVVEALIDHSYEISPKRYDYYKATRRPSDVNKKERRLIASSLYTQQSRPPLAPRVQKIRLAPTSPKSKQSDAGDSRAQQSRSTTNLTYEHGQSTTSSSSKHVSDDEDRAAAARKRGKRSNSVLGALKSLKKSVTNMAPLGLMDKEERNHLFLRRHTRTNNRDDALLMSPSRRICMDPMVKSSDSESPPFVHDLGRHNVDDVLKVRSPIRSEKKRPPLPNFESFTPVSDEKKENSAIGITTALGELDLFKPTPPIRRESAKIFPLTPSNSNLSSTTSSSRLPPMTPQHMARRAEPKVVDRTRRATVPAKLNALRRNAPNAKASGLNLPTRSHYSFRRLSPGVDSLSSVSSEDDSPGVNASIDDILGMKGLESRRRRRLKKRNTSGDHSMTNLLQSSMLASPELGTTTPTPSQTTPIRSTQPINVPDKLEPSETSDLMTTTDQSSPELRRSMLHHSPKSNPLTPTKSSMSSLIHSKSPMRSPALSVDVHVSRPTELLCSEVTPSSDSGCSSSASSKPCNHGNPAAVTSVSGTTISSEASTSNDRCPSPIFLEPILPKRFHTRPMISSSTQSIASSVVVRPSGTSVYMPTESFRAKCRSPVRRPSASSTTSNSSRKASRSPGRMGQKSTMRMSTFDASAGFDDVSRARFGLASSTSAMEWGRPSINKIQGSGVVNMRIQQFNTASPSSRSSNFAPVPEHPTDTTMKPMSYKPSFTRPTIASSTSSRSHGSMIPQRSKTPQRSLPSSSQFLPNQRSRLPSGSSSGFRF